MSSEEDPGREPTSTPTEQFGSAEGLEPTGQTAQPDRGDDAQIKERDLTDPKVMRALAHPVRMALIELFSYNDTLTATQAGELLGESPANAAFHLRTLAKYGFVEETGGGRGRERPWRTVKMRLNIDTERLDTQAGLAADALNQAWMERAFDRARHAARLGAPKPEGWRSSSHSTQTSLYLTPEEFDRISAEVLEMFGRYSNRHERATSPPGSHPVELLFLGHALTGMTAAEHDNAESDNAESENTKGENTEGANAEPENVRPSRHNHEQN